MTYRENCYICKLAACKCICSKIKKIQSQIQVVILQYLKEDKKAIGTAKIVALSLINSILIKSFSFNENKRYQKILNESYSRHFYLLYPDEDAIPVEEVKLKPNKINTLLVLDGTWSHAFKILKETNLPTNITKIKLDPQTHSNYKIRTQPNNKCLSTVESVVQTLNQIDDSGLKYDSMLDTFNEMINQQLPYIPKQHLKKRKAFKKEINA